MKIFIVIPVYNEEDRIEAVIAEIKKSKFKTVFIDDGSSDDSWKKLRKLKSRSTYFPVRHKINLGKGAAMKTGADLAFSLGAEAVVFMDSDGQHSIKDIYKFTKKLKKYDVVFGERKISKDTSIRIYGSRMLSVLVRILFGIELVDLLCGYRALTKKAYKKIRWDSSGYGVETEMVVRVGKNGISYTRVEIPSVYHDTFKGFALTDAFKILYNIFVWRITI